MKKNVVQDVIPPKKSIRNIELSSKAGEIIAKKQTPIKIDNIAVTPPAPKIESFTRRVPISDQAPIRIEAAPPASSFTKSFNGGFNPPPPAPPKTPLYHYEYDETKKSSRKKLYITLGILILALVFGISALFKGATIKVTPEQEHKSVDNTFNAKKDSLKDQLGFQLVTISSSLEKNVESTGTEKVEKKAEGKVVLYNNYSSSSQKLVATTRLETPEGLIFRLINPVTIPGKQTIAGKSVAGSVETTVIADVPGEAYNVGLKDFTVVGFKKEPVKYAQIYARSKTTMSGGFEGQQKIVSGDIIDKTEVELETTLGETLSKNIISQIPANFILYPDSLSYKFDRVTQSDSGEGGVVLNKKGEASGIIFDKSILTQTILTKVSPDLTDNAVKINNLETLVFSYATGTSFNPDVDNIATFNLKGDANLVWVIDENKLKSDLLGLSKKNATAIISTYSTIKEAWVETRPFWNQTIPSNPEKVTLINTLAN